MKTREIAVLLHDIRSVHNVGSIFRTADALGIAKIYLSGFTPTPKDRFGRDRRDVAKVSLGAEKSIDWEEVPDPIKLIKELKKKKYKIISIEQSEKSKDYKKVKVETPTLFILGSEVEGISKEILSLSDVIAEIPMKGKKESLNVSVSFGVALFRMLGV
jgi:tRNA G18 (ribose-2'-O)-methylase SpoU